jgi:histidine triad (HIT) family protein
MWRRPAASLPRWDRSARIWCSRDSREGANHAELRSNNIFAKILRGELPCHKVYEDDKALAFLDIMPRAPGHTLVLPKAPARNLLDVDPADLAHVMQVAQKIAKAGMKVFAPTAVTVQQFNESAGGQVVFHLHVHVIPRQRRRADEAAGEREGGSRGAVGSGAQARGGATGVSAVALLLGDPRAALRRNALVLHLGHCVHCAFGGVVQTPLDEVIALLVQDVEVELRTARLAEQITVQKGNRDIAIHAALAHDVLA